MMRFGERLRTLRLRMGLTQAELADKVGVSNTYISALESGRKPAPPRAIVAALSRALKAQEADFWKIAYSEREQRLLGRIDGVPTSLRRTPSLCECSANKHREALRAAFEALDEAIEDGGRREHVISAIEQYIEGLRSKKDNQS